MRPRNQSARDQLVAVLGRTPRARAAALAAAIEVSVPTLHRLLDELPVGELLSAGHARRARYALRRAVRGDLSDIPLYAIDPAGNAAPLSELALVRPEGTLLPLAETAWPVPREVQDGWWEGLPYPLYDMRPQGYMGRQLARAEHRRLGVSVNPREWSDDDVVFVLAQVGSDVSGNLLLGNPAYDLWLRTKLSPPDPIGEAGRGTHYAERAQGAVAGGLVGSSAAGEFPKFAALRTRADQTTPHVLVKFSGAGEAAAERRWADLLVCEHLALEQAASLPGVAIARTCVVQHEGRTFLEVERFDRVDLFGRLPLCSLDALNLAFLGDASTDWTRLAKRLHDEGLLDAAMVRAIELLWWFGRLIANTDMHLGNLGFFPGSTLRLAPAYDMLPMAYAPMPGGEVPQRGFDPPLPLPAQRAIWQVACGAAVAFWREASADPRISGAFQAVCAGNVQQLNDIAARV